jgi:hypothetical protein
LIVCVVKVQELFKEELLPDDDVNPFILGKQTSKGLAHVAKATLHSVEVQEGEQ